MKDRLEIRSGAGFRIRRLPIARRDPLLRQLSVHPPQVGDVPDLCRPRLKRVRAALHFHEDVVAVDDRHLKMGQEVAAARELFVVEERVVNVIREDRRGRLRDR